MIVLERSLSSVTRFCFLILIPFPGTVHDVSHVGRYPTVGDLASQDQHRIPEAVEAVPFGHGLVVRSVHQFLSGESRH